MSRGHACTWSAEMLLGTHVHTVEHDSCGIKPVHTDFEHCIWTLCEMLQG